MGPEFFVALYAAIVSTGLAARTIWRERQRVRAQLTRVVGHGDRWELSITNNSRDPVGVAEVGFLDAGGEPIRAIEPVAGPHGADEEPAFRAPRTLDTGQALLVYFDVASSVVLIGDQPVRPFWRDGMGQIRSDVSFGGGRFARGLRPSTPGRLEP